MSRYSKAMATKLQYTSMPIVDERTFRYYMRVSMLVWWVLYIIPLQQSFFNVQNKVLLCLKSEEISGKI